MKIKKIAFSDETEKNGTINNQQQFQNFQQPFQFNQPQFKPTAETILSQIKNEFKNDS